MTTPPVLNSDILSAADSRLTLAPKVLARFWRKVDIKSKDECWQWHGTITSGYGVFAITSKHSVRAHRVAYELLVGPIPDSMVSDHLCRNRSCCNPNHIDIVSNKENVLRGIGPTAINGQKVTCKHGHPFSEENTRTFPQGNGLMRICKTCALERTRKWREKLKQQSASLAG